MKEIKLLELKLNLLTEIIKNKDIKKEELARIRLVMDSPESIRMIKDPSSTVRKLALILDGLTIKYLSNPTIDEERIALSSNGLAIYYIENPTDDLKWLAIKNNIDAMFLIKKIDSYMKQYVAERNGYYACFMDEIDDKTLESAALAIYNSELYTFNSSSEMTIVNNREKRIEEIKAQIIRKQLPKEAINLQIERESLIKKFVLSR